MGKTERLISGVHPSETKKRKQQQLFELVARFRNASNAEEAKALGDALGRMLFGADVTPEPSEYQVRLIKKGLRAAEEGKLASRGEMKKLIAKMGRKERGSRANVKGRRLQNG